MLIVLTKFETLQTFKGQIVFQEFIQMLLIMSVFWKKIEFWNGESDCEAIIIVLMVCGGQEGVLRVSPSRQVFPLLESFPPAIFSPSPWKTYRGIVTWNGTLKSKNSLKYEQQNELILKGVLKNFLPVACILQEFAIHDYKSLPQAEYF